MARPKPFTFILHHNRAKSIDCPKCGAKANFNCIRSDGKGSRTHVERVIKWERNTLERFNKMNEIKLTATFNAFSDGSLRINHLKGKIIDGQMQIFISNGKRNDGTRIDAAIRLSQENMKQLLKFLQCNIK